MRPGQCAGGRSPPDLSNPRWIKVCAVLGVAEGDFRTCTGEECVLFGVDDQITNAFVG